MYGFGSIVAVLSSDSRPEFFLPTLPALARVARAFPPLIDDVITLLVQLGKISTSHLSIVGACIRLPSDGM